MQAAEMLTEEITADLVEAMERGDIRLALGYHQYISGAASAFYSSFSDQVSSILEGHVPTVPSDAAKTLAAVKKLLADEGASLSLPTRSYLARLVVELDSVASDRRAQEHEMLALRRASVALDALSAESAGVYVYTFPHYLRNPYSMTPGQQPFRVGATPGGPEGTISGQMQAYDMPEEPVVLRFWPTAEGDDPFVASVRMQEMLRESGHRSMQSSDEEGAWFHTSLDALDVFAQIVGLRGMPDLS